jgi:ABC-type antimicrobial peptide transport system permease subunit
VFKRVIRSWRLFAALLLGVVMASTFFAGINIGADTAAKQALDQHLRNVPIDIAVRSGWEPIWSSANATEIANVISSSDIKGVASAEVISRAGWPGWMVQVDNKTAYFVVVGISEGSRVYDGLTVTEGSSSLNANETYVWADAPSASDLKLGEVISANFSVWLGEDSRPEQPEEKWITINLTVAGFVELDDKASQIALGYSVESTRVIIEDQEHVVIDPKNLLIADWDKTFAKLLDALYDMSPLYSPIETNILVFLDRASVIGPWDIGTSIDKVRAVTSQIENKVLGYHAYAQNYLENALQSFQFTSQNMTLQFIVIALPVFFMAWYMGTTVSDVSFNMRRREIGLLLTKGFSRSQLLRMFLSEAALIGVMGGLIGVGLSLLLSPFFVKAGGGEWFSAAPVVGVETVVLAVIFSVIITFLSMFRPARRASQLQAVDALRAYHYVEEVKPSRQRWSWIALILGTYKIVIWLLGINLLTMTMGPPPTSNIIVLILLSIWIFLDVFILNYIGPLLFFWGLTKLLIRGSIKFQELTARTAKFLGDLSSLATRNVQRNPARTASTAFLVALIIWYSFLATGAYASERDQKIRQIKFNVGADISVTLTTLTNASQTLSAIEGLPGVSSTVMEYSFYGESSFVRLDLKAVNPEKWLATAFYEGEWFRGNDAKTAFQQMTTDNNTIILGKRIASRLNLRLNDEITLIFGDADTRALRVVGFFGLQRSEEMSGYSYVPEGVYYEVKDSVSARGKILVKLAPGADGKAVADQIREFETNNIGAVYSVAEELQRWQSDVLLTATLNFQLLGVAFAVIAASIGTALVTLVSLKERSKEVSIMSVRGLSFKQLATMLLTENLAVVVFALLLGTIVGLITVYWNVSAMETMPFFSPVLPYASPVLAHHVVFPMDIVLTLLACFVLVLASTVIPVIIMSRRYVSRLERMVREA